LRIYITAGEKTLGEKQANKLLKDAIYWHLISEGYSEYKAKVETDKAMAKRRFLKGDII